MATNNSYTIRDILRIFFSHKVFFIVIPSVLVLSAYVGYELNTSLYEAHVKMFVKGEKKTEAEFYVGVGKLNPVGEHVGLIRSNAVIGRVVQALKLYDRPLDYEKRYASPLKKAFLEAMIDKNKIPSDSYTRFATAMNELNSNITITPDIESNMLTIGVTDYNPNLAMKIANSVSRSYVIFDLEQNIEELKLKYGEKHQEVQQLKAYVEDFKKTLNGEKISDIKAFGPASVKIVAQAESADMRRKIPKTFLLLFSFFTGIFLAVVFAAVFEYTDNTFKTTRKIAEHLNLPVLGSLPKVKSKEKVFIKETSPQLTQYLKSFQNLIEQLSLSIGEMKAILITDMEASKETAIISANLGIFFAHIKGRKVLIIDSDLRSSSLSNTLNVTNNDAGIANILEGNSSMINAIHDMGSNLHFLPSGRTVLNPGMLLNSRKMIDLICKVKEEYDLIFICCPDLKNYTEPAIISSLADGIIFVINEGKVRKQVLDNAIAPLIKKRVNMLGIIFNNRTYVIPRMIYKLT